MKNVSLAAGVAIIVVANAFALIHAARNRAGTPDAELTLTNRELSYYSYSPSDDDSGVTLNLRWAGAVFYYSSSGSVSDRWLDQQKLRQLGFDCSVNPAGEHALRFYQRQRPRQAFVALEYDGPAWLAWLDNDNRAAAERAKSGAMTVGPTEHQSHLVAIDADLDAGALRARHPDRSSVVIVPAVVAIGLYPYPGRKADPKDSVHIQGTIQQFASSIHVPRPYSDAFPRRDQRKNVNNEDLSYKVRLRYGSLLEPWVTGVDFHP